MKIHTISKNVSAGLLCAAMLSLTTPASADAAHYSVVSATETDGKPATKKQLAVMQAALSKSLSEAGGSYTGDQVEAAMRGIPPVKKATLTYESPKGAKISLTLEF